MVAPNEYGFYSNVNNTVDHPRWSQATERRIGIMPERNPLIRLSFVLIRVYVMSWWLPITITKFGDRPETLLRQLMTI